MSWRVISISGVAKLDLKLGFMMIRKEEISKIALNEIGILIIDSTAVSLTAALLCELSNRNIKIIFCDTSHNPYGELIPLYGSHDSSLKIKEQYLWDQNTKSEIWTLIVAQKIKKQKLFLNNLGLKKQANLLSKYVEEMLPNDASNREGHAAKVYFNALFGKNFCRDDDTPINSALNYGYSLLLSIFNKEICSCGYLTQPGIFHDNRFNPFNLSSDLMEPFRVLVDKIVFYLKCTKFEKDEKLKLLEIFNTIIICANCKRYLANAISIYTKSIFDSLNSDIVKIDFYDEL